MRFHLTGLCVGLLLAWTGGCGDDLTDKNELLDYSANTEDTGDTAAGDTSAWLDLDSDGVPETPVDSAGDSAGDSGENSRDTDTSNPQAGLTELVIQAECAIGEFTGDCNAKFSGDFGARDGVYEMPRIDDGQPGVVGYTTGGTWLRYDNIDLTGKNSITMRLASNENDAALSVHVDSQSGPELAYFNLGNTGGWDVFVEKTEPFKVGFTGNRDLFIVAETDYIGNGNIDWFKLTTDSLVTIPVDPTYLHIEAECAISPSQGDCDGAYTGGTSESEAIWGGPDSYPNVEADTPNAIGYLVGDGATWIRFDNVDLTGMKSVRVKAGVADESCGLKFYVDGPDDQSGTRIAALSTPSTGSWDTHQLFETPLETAVDGVHDLYVMGGNPKSGNAQLDWIEFE